MYDKDKYNFMMPGSPDHSARIREISEGKLSDLEPGTGVKLTGPKFRKVLIEECQGLLDRSIIYKIGFHETPDCVYRDADGEYHYYKYTYQDSPYIECGKYAVRDSRSENIYCLRDKVYETIDPADNEDCDIHFRNENGDLEYFNYRKVRDV